MSDDTTPPENEAPDPAAPADPSVVDPSAIDPAVTDVVDRGDSSFGSAAMWSYVMDGSRVFSALLVTLILAKLLSTADFGIAALALTFVLLVRLVLQNGMIAAIIQRDGLEERHMNAGFWLVVSVGGVLTVLMVLGAPWLAGLTKSDSEVFVDVLRVLSSIILIGVLGVLPEAIARRQMDFRPLAVRTTVASLIGSTVAIVAAFSGAGVWAIVAQQVVTEFVALVLLWVITPWRPTLSLDRSAVRDIAPFWALTSLGSLGGFLRWRADTLLVGAFFPDSTVGLYRFSSRFPETWSEVSIRAIQSLALPELSKHQLDKEKFAERVLFMVKMSAIVSIPALGVLAGLSEPLIDIVGADKWGDANIGIKLVAAATAANALSFFSAPALQAIGRTGVLAALTWFHAIVSIVAFGAIGLVLDGESELAQVTGSTAGRLGVLLLAASVDIVVIAKYTAVRRRDIISAVVPSFLIAAAAFGTTSLVVWVLDPLPAVLTGGFAGLIGGVTLLVASLVFEPQARDLAGKAPVVGPKLAAIFGSTPDK